MFNRSKSAMLIGVLNIPTFLLYTILFTWPMLQVIYLSFFEWNGMKRVPKIFVGIQNYVQLFQSIDFYKSLQNSLVFVVSAVLIVMPVSFMLALLLNVGLKGSGFFKSVYYIPSVLPVAVSGLLWVFMLSTPAGASYSEGVITTIIQFFVGKDFRVRWLSDRSIAIWVVAIVNAWRVAGHYMLFFLTGLTSISREMIEAAIADGAGPFRRLIYIIVPNMKETFKIFLILNLAGAFKTFDIVYVMTQGGPANATQVPVTLLYNHAFSYFGSFGYGAAIGVTILVITMLISYFTNHKLNQEE